MVIRQNGNETFFINKYCHGKITCIDLVIEVSMMQVEVKYRQKGYAKKLMKYILHYIQAVYPNTKKIILSPLPLASDGLDLESLMKFYKKFGFEESKEHPREKPHMMEMVLKS